MQTDRSSLTFCCVVLHVQEQLHRRSSFVNYHLSSTCTEVSGVENIGQCDRLSQLSWLLGAL